MSQGEKHHNEDVVFQMQGLHRQCNDVPYRGDANRAAAPLAAGCCRKQYRENMSAFFSMREGVVKNICSHL